MATLKFSFPVTVSSLTKTNAKSNQIVFTSQIHSKKTKNNEEGMSAMLFASHSTN